MARRTSAELERLVEKVSGWREKQGGRRSRIPDELWQEAVRVTREVGVWAAAKALRLNYQALRHRVDLGRVGGERAMDRVRSGRGQDAVKGVRPKIAAAEGAERVRIATRMKGNRGQGAPEKAGPEFIALEMGQLGGVRRTVIDLESRHGDRMRFEVAGGVDIVSLVHRLWGGQP